MGLLNYKIMKDKISVERLVKLHPKLRDNFQKFIEELENTFHVTIRISQGLRTIAEQDALYAQGRTTMGAIVTNARGGESWHNYGCATDLVVLVNGQPDWEFDYSKFHPIAINHGLTWGGEWTHKDLPHFENNLGHGSSGWKWAFDMVKSGKVDKEGYILI